MKLVIAFLFLCIVSAVYLILCELLHMPSMASTRVVLMMTQKSKNAKGYHAMIARLSSELAKRIHLTPYKRRTMEATLKYAGISLTPENYYAQIAVKAAICLLPAVICLFIFPIGSIIFVLLMIKQVMKGLREAQTVVRAKREKIDCELPRFVETVAQELESSHDVLSILEGYRASAGDLFRDELEITIAEMKSGSQEQALNHLSGRVGSAMLGQIVRGLLGVVRGANEVLYFNLLAHDFQNSEEQKSEKEVLKRPDEMKKYFYLMLFCFIAIYGYVLFVQIVSSSGSLF